MRLRPLLCLALLGAGHSAAGSVRLLGVTTIPADAAADGVPVGGVSGIDYDAQSGAWFLISDDRSEHGSARYWRTAIRLAIARPPRLIALRTYRIRRPDGRFFPAPGTGQEALDSESIRKIPHRRALLWSSEGDARDGFGPSLRSMSLSGQSGAPLPLPKVFAFDPTQKRGPRPNLSIEGVSFEPDGKHLWASLEAPLFQDGELASREAGATIRLSRLTYPALTLAGQFAYQVDPIGPAPDGRLADNGVSEILALDSRHILVLERSGIQQADGDFGYRSRLYCADTGVAQSIASVDALRGRSVVAATKRLVFDFSTVQSPRIDNVEGMTLGPALPNGARTIVFVTDNDFSPRRHNQLIALEITGPNRRAGLVQALCPPAG